MKIVCCLSWYDESPAWLATVVAAAAKAGCNHIVAVDGPYALLTATGRSSGVLQQDAVTHAAHVAGIGLTLHVPDSPFGGNEVEKRSLMFRLAEQITTEDDWLWVLDADCFVTKAVDLRRRLQETDLNVAEVMVCNSSDPQVIKVSQHKQPLRLLYRAVRGLEVAGAHYYYRYPRDGGWSYLWGNMPLEPALQLHDVEVEHWTEQRDKGRQAEQHAYYHLRDQVGAESVSETWVEGLDGQPMKLRG